MVNDPKLKTVEWDSEDVADFPAFVDLNDPDDVEVQLIDWAQAVSTKAKAPEVRAVGRVIKTFVPAFCEVLREENKRNTNKGDILNGFMNVSGLFMSLVLSGVVKRGKEKEAVDRMIRGLDLMLRSRVAHAEQVEEPETWGPKVEAKPPSTSVPTIVLKQETI